MINFEIPQPKQTISRLKNFVSWVDQATKISIGVGDLVERYDYYENYHLAPKNNISRLKGLGFGYSLHGPNAQKIGPKEEVNLFYEVNSGQNCQAAFDEILRLQIDRLGVDAPVEPMETSTDNILRHPSFAGSFESNLTSTDKDIEVEFEIWQSAKSADKDVRETTRPKITIFKND